MRGSVLLVLASLGLATVVSMLLWTVRRITWRRPIPFLERLGSVSPVPGRAVGPASGISRLDPMNPAPEAVTSNVGSDALSDRPADVPLDVSADSPAGSER